MNDAVMKKVAKIIAYILVASMVIAPLSYFLF